MKRIAFISVLTAMLSTQAFALDIGNVTSTMKSSEAILSKEVKNLAPTGRFIHVRVVRMSNPYDDGKTIPMQTPNELLFSPSVFIMPSHTEKNVKFFYNGPSDDQERYYRIYWLDESISRVNIPETKKAAIATTSVVIGSILVVAPRKQHFNYQFNPKNNTITNKGNVSFRVLISGPCKKLNEGQHSQCNARRRVSPNRSLVISSIKLNDKSSHVSIWQDDNFIVVK